MFRVGFMTFASWRHAFYIIVSKGVARRGIWNTRAVHSPKTPAFSKCFVLFNKILQRYIPWASAKISKRGEWIDQKPLFQSPRGKTLYFLRLNGKNRNISPAWIVKIGKLPRFRSGHLTPPYPLYLPTPMKHDFFLISQNMPHRADVFSQIASGQ